MVVEDQPPTAWNIAGPREYGFILKRKPKPRPPALEPEDGAANRRVRVRDTLMSTAMVTRSRSSTPGWI